MNKYIFFDCDGTLSNNEPCHKLSRDRLLTTLGLDPKVYSDKAIGFSKMHFWKNIVSWCNITSYTSEELAKKDFEMLFEIIKENNVKLSPNLITVLDKLVADGNKCYIVSSSNREYLENVLKYWKIDSYFSGIFSGDEVVKAKPDPEIYIKAYTSIGVDSKDCYAIEDSHSGVTAAKKANIYTIAYKPDEYSVYNDDVSKADIIIKDMIQILNIIK